MKKSEILLAVVLLLAAGGLVLGFLLNQSSAPFQGPAPMAGGQEPDGPKGEPATPQPMEAPPEQTPVRQPLGPGEPEPGERRVQIGQGVRGVVVDPFNQPLSGTEVLVAEAFNPVNFLASIARTQSMPKRRFNKTLTDEAGRFELAFDPNVNADVFVRHPSFQLEERKGVHIPTEGLEDLGVIALKQGLTIQGHVRSAVTGQALPEATVRLSQPGSMAFQAAPGEEDGVLRTTDATGAYRLAGLKPGAYTVEAFAKGHARESRANIGLAEGAAPTEVDFSLKEGLSISGMVVDGDGKPVAAARVEAVSYSVQAPVTGTARSDEKGLFEVLGLPEGNYRLTAQAEGFTEGKKNMAAAGSDDSILVVQRQGSVTVQVVGRHGRALPDYTLELRQVHQGQKMYGRTAVPPVNVRNARQGRYTMSGINPGTTYVLRVEAPGYAMAFSPPFPIELGQPTPEVMVQLSQGGTLRGTVVDSLGAPVAGAQVSTMSNEFEDNPFTAMFGPLIPQQHTRTSALTGPGGEFTLKLVMPETYQLKVTHKDFPTTYHKNVVVPEGQDGPVVELPPIQLPVGVVVFGVAYDPNGQPIKGGKVSMQGDQGTTFGAEAMTDEKGRFALTPAPPGQYKLQCSRPAGENIFMTVVDFKKSETPITITGSQRRMEIRLQIQP